MTSPEKSSQSSHLTSWEQSVLVCMIDNQNCCQLTFCLSNQSTNGSRINIVFKCLNTPRLTLKLRVFRGAPERSKVLGAHEYDVMRSDRAVTCCSGYARGSHQQMFRTKYSKYPLFMKCSALNGDGLVIIEGNQCGSSDSHERRPVFRSACLYFKFISASWLANLFSS